MESYDIPYWYLKNRPRPWDGKRLKWRPGALIETLPSVIQTGAGVEGPSRTVLAQIMRERPLLRLLQAPKGYHGLGRPSDPGVVAISPGWQTERPGILAITEAMGANIVSINHARPAEEKAGEITGNRMSLEWST